MHAYSFYDELLHLNPGLQDVNVHYVRSNDFFRSQHEKLVNCGNQFDILAGKVSAHLVQKVESEGIDRPNTRA